jgi:REP element-mobilizing transposase RayT
VRNPEANPLRSGLHTRGYLPHLKREGTTYFVTYRLEDSLPKPLLLKLEAERAQRMRVLSEKKSGGAKAADSLEDINRDFRREVERALDAGYGSCHLKVPAVAQLVADNLRYFDGQRYLLGEWVVMPNHVHVVVWPLPNQLLSEILKTWKQYTSLRAKEILGLGPGAFWQRESYDHWIRNAEEQVRIVRYVRNNPVTARLCRQPGDWPWSSASTGAA